MRFHCSASLIPPLFFVLRLLRGNFSCVSFFPVVIVILVVEVAVLLSHIGRHHPHRQWLRRHRGSSLGLKNLLFCEPPTERETKRNTEKYATTAQATL